jgi:hypothetical protein
LPRYRWSTQPALELPAVRSSVIGTAVFYGMLGNTFLGLSFTPVLYVAITSIVESTEHAQSEKGRLGEPNRHLPSPTLGAFL